MTVTRFPDRPTFIVADSIREMFDEIGVQVPPRASLAAGAQFKTNAPCQMRSGRRSTPDFSVAIDADGMGAMWNCKRSNHCDCNALQKAGGGKVRAPGGHRVEAPQRRERAPAVKPTPHSAAQQDRGESLYAWFAKRGITRETVDAFGIYGVGMSWGGDGAKKPTVVFPYVWRGELVSRKFRSIDKDFRQDKDSLRALFNADAVTSPDEVIMVEGEMDVLALWEAGFRQVVSLPDGAPAKLYDEDDPRRRDDKRFDAIENCGEILADVKRVIIATDGDPPGGYLAEEFARRLGRVRCWRVTWPEDCKDANDVLMKHGADALQRCIAAAHPWPLAGLWSPKPGTLREWLASGKEPRGLESGIKALDEIARLPAGGGWLTVVTGVPSHGKSAFLRCWLAYIAAKHDIGIVWCSPEDNRPEVIATRLAEILKGQPAREAGMIMPAELLNDAERWIAQHITFLWSDDPDTEMTLDWSIKRVEEAKKRQPRQLFVLDPWNEVEHQYGKNESETQYVGRWLRRLKAWGRAEAVGVLIAAHPTKMQVDPKTKKLPIADAYDISGGANWANRADLLLSIYRREEGFMEIHTKKARFPAFGKRQGQARLKLDQRTGRLSSVAIDDTTHAGTEDGSDG